VATAIPGRQNPEINPGFALISLRISDNIYAPSFQGQKGDGLRPFKMVKNHSK
jgi:hypothetical protein